MSSCPLCKSTILQYTISLHAEFTMCSNEDCVYPFQDEKICQTSIIDKRVAGAQGTNRKRKATAPSASLDPKAKVSDANTLAIKKRKAAVVGSSAPIPNRKLVTATPLSPNSRVIGAQPTLPIHKPSISTAASSTSALATAAMKPTVKKIVKVPKAATSSSTVAAIPKNYATTTPSKITTAISTNYASTHATTTATTPTTATALPTDFTTLPTTPADTAIPTNFVVSPATTTTTAIPNSIATTPAITAATASMSMSAIPESGLPEDLFALAALSTAETTGITTGIIQATSSSNSSIPTSPVEALPDLTFDFLPSESWTTPVTPPDMLLQLDNSSKVLDQQTEVSTSKLEDLLFDDEFYNDFGNIEGSTVQPEFDADFEAMLQQQF